MPDCEEGLKKQIRVCESELKLVHQHFTGTTIDQAQHDLAVTRLDLLEHRVEKLFQLRGADIGVRRKLEMRIAKLEKK